jgi:hypothetical protein
MSPTQSFTSTIMCAHVLGFALLLALCVCTICSVNGLSFCDKYSLALYNTTDGATEQALITAIITRAVLGDMTATPPVPGIVGTDSPLLPWFDGTYQYRHADEPPAPDYLTNATALATLASHLVSFAGAAFGCTGTPFNTTNYNANHQYVHNKMGIGQTQMDFFNTQLALTLLSYGVTEEDVTDIAVPLLGSFQRGAGTAEICTQANCWPVANPFPPTTLTFCEKYSYALFNGSTFTEEISLIAAVVTTAALGSNGTASYGVKVAGLVAPNSPLLAILNGSVPYRQDGSTAPNYLANSTEFAVLAAKFVAFFGSALGCNSDGFPSYYTSTSQNYIHALMGIDDAKISYFDTQVASALLYYGVPSTGSDISAAATFLGSFNKGAGPNEICNLPDCPTVLPPGTASDESSLATFIIIIIVVILVLTAIVGAILYYYRSSLLCCASAPKDGTLLDHKQSYYSTG